MLNKGKNIVEAVSILDTILHTKLIYKKPDSENLHWSACSLLGHLYSYCCSI